VNRDAVTVCSEPSDRPLPRGAKSARLPRPASALSRWMSAAWKNYIGTRLACFIHRVDCEGGERWHVSVREGGASCAVWPGIAA
jgi:hypothetical protein